jgi:hypothetical protein
MYRTCPISTDSGQSRKRHCQKRTGKVQMLVRVLSEKRILDITHTPVPAFDGIAASRPSLLKNSLLSFSREHELNWPKRFSIQMNKGTAIEKS